MFYFASFIMGFLACILTLVLFLAYGMKECKERFPGETFQFQMSLKQLLRAIDRS